MTKNRKKIIVMLVTIELLTMFLMYKSSHNKEIVLDNKIETKEKLAIKVINNEGEYESSNTFPGKGYVLNNELTKCYDQEEKKVDNPKITSNGESITLTSNKTLYCTLYYYLPESREYDYTGDYQVFIAPMTGNYQIELWGASGGGIEEVREVGRGAYTKGQIHLEKNEKLYIYVGENKNEYGGNLTILPYNGGGPGETSGGGATDVRLKIAEDGSWDNFDSLKSRIMVAAGGGGGAWYLNIDYTQPYQRGDGGTLKGIDAIFYYYNVYLEPTYATYNYSGHGGTQTSGGGPGTIFKGYIDPELIPEMTGKFGKGGYGINAIIEAYKYTSSGGGGGYYGGGHGNHPYDSWTGGGGGSSFISGQLGCVAIKEESTEENVQPKDGCTNDTTDIECSYHYSNKIFTDTLMLAGNSQMPTHDGKGMVEGNTGNGYAKITFVN